MLVVRGSGTISASCSLLPFPVLADDRDGDADDEESRRRRRRREGPVLPPAAAADLDVECRRRKQSNGFLLFLPAIIVLSCFPGSLGELHSTYSNEGVFLCRPKQAAKHANNAWEKVAQDVLCGQDTKRKE